MPQPRRRSLQELYAAVSQSSLRHRRSDSRRLVSDRPRQGSGGASERFLWQSISTELESNGFVKELYSGK